MMLAAMAIREIKAMKATLPVRFPVLPETRE